VQILTEREINFPDNSRNYNIEIKKGINILQKNWRRIYRHNFSYKKSEKMLKMINENHNNRILN
jgi:hypothetical protein